MLTQLLQWLKTSLNRPVRSKQTNTLNNLSEQQVVEPPKLNNADLEVLFNQLLEGVHQGRGQQWARDYLERMEDRISVERWIDWLLGFGEKLLLSPVPNDELATRMVQLGELGIGQVGELSYDIGIRLLRRDSSEWYEDEEPANETSTTFPTLLDSPGQELIRNLGELLWESDEPEVELETGDLELGTRDWEDLNRASSNQVLQEFLPQSTVPSTTNPSTDSSLTEEELVNNSEEIIWEYQGEAAETTNESTDVRPLLTPAEEDTISDLGELTFGYEAREFLTTTPAQRNWDQSLTNLQPNVAYTLDELLVRLDQSSNLVQQLAANLATQKSQNLIKINQNAGNQAQTCFYQGLHLAKTGDLLGAIASYNQAIELNPHAYEYWFNRGLTLFHLEQFTEAIASYDQAIRLKPDYSTAWYKRGGTCGEIGQFEEAIASFEQAIEIQPSYAEAWASKGLALLKLGQLWEAIASYDQALLLQPQDQENWYFRGIALALGEQHEDAIASYDQALEIQPDYHEVWIDRGVVLFNLKRWSEAIASWDQALAIQPDFYLAWYNRGVALDNLGQRQEAIASYRQAIAIKPDFHLAWYNQAIALFYLEQYTQAIDSYDHALEIKPDYWEAWIGRGSAIGHLVHVEGSLQKSFENKLACYEEGLKHVRLDTHPEGWGRLHFAIGNTYYDRGKKHPTSRNDWHQALTEYNQALLTLTSEDFPQLHLEVLQSLIKVLLSLGEIAQAQELQQRSAVLLQQLLSEPTRTDESKKQLALKFAGIGQFAVDLYVEYGDVVEAWEMAEYSKNSCLTWMLNGWYEQIYSPRYYSVQQLLNPSTAIIYWHLSPVALNTFVIKNEAPSPILIFIPIQNVGTIGNATPFQELSLPEAVKRLIEFEDWLENWHQAHKEYHKQAQYQQNKSNYSWRLEMEQKLLHLKEILQISTIEQELEGISQLILVPHRDLHTLPLHALFNLSYPYEEYPSNVKSSFTISYLPSIQIGLSVRTEHTRQLSEQKLLSVEHPNSTSYPTLKSAKLESEIVSQMFNHPQRIQGTTATKNLVETALFDNYNIFHFTGNVINNYLEPTKSELLLAGEDKLSLEEIWQGNFNSYYLVTLSACETIRSNHQTITTEYLSLAGGLICTGVPYVVSSLWTVESSATALVIVEFYRRLQQNKSATTALTEATAWLKELTAGELTKWYEDLLNNLDIDELKVRAYLVTHLYRTSKMAANKKLYNHPYYWAAFTIIGKQN